MRKGVIRGLAGCGLTLWILPAPALAELIYGISVTSIFTFDSATPLTITTPVTVTGLQAGEVLQAIDLRPATGQLYVLGSTSRLYTVDPATGVATQVGSAGAFTLSGLRFGFDFNPVADRIRVVSEAEQNLRLNPNDGTLTANDIPLAYATGDPNFGADPHVVASAYTNNLAGAVTTTLYGIDTRRNTLVIQNPPNDGLLSTVGALGVIAFGDVVGFDISGTSGVAYATIFSMDGFAHLYRIDLSTGAATDVDRVAASVVGITVGVPVTPTPTPTATATPTATVTRSPTTTSTPTSTVTGAPVPAADVPTLSGWAMLAMISVIGALGYFVIRSFSSSS